MSLIKTITSFDVLFEIVEEKLVIDFFHAEELLTSLITSFMPADSSSNKLLKNSRSSENFLLFLEKNIRITNNAVENIHT